MEIKTISISEFVKGHPERQEYYKQGRKRTELQREEISAVCSCGYLTLKPTNEFEKHYGGLTVRRKNVFILDGLQIIKRLRPRKDRDGYDDIMTHDSCNACVNNWK